MADSEKENGVQTIENSSNEETNIKHKNETDNEITENTKENKLSTIIEEGKSTDNQDNNICEEDSLDNKLDYSKELYNTGSRNFLLKNYQLAADELGEACGLYEEIYGPESDELGMPLLLYAKSLIALSLDENKVLDVPDVEYENDSEEEPEEEEDGTNASKGKSSVNEISNSNGNIDGEAHSTSSSNAKDQEQPGTSIKAVDLTIVASSSNQANIGDKANGNDEEEEDTDATNLQIAWETLELSAKIFSKQGLSGLPNLAEIHTELANIQFENEIFDAAREDYGKALKIYDELPIKEHRRARAEIHYKIGLTFLLETRNQEGVEAFKTACDVLSDVVEEIKNKKDLTDSDKNMIKDIEETQQDINAKIAEVEETRQQVIDEIRAALNKCKSQNSENGGPSSSIEPLVPSSSKPNDISHLIKRKKPDTASPEGESSPAKRLNTEKTG